MVTRWGEDGGALGLGKDGIWGCHDNEGVRDLYGRGEGARGGERGRVPR